MKRKSQTEMKEEKEKEKENLNACYKLLLLLFYWRATLQKLMFPTLYFLVRSFPFILHWDLDENMATFHTQVLHCTQLNSWATHFSLSFFLSYVIYSVFNSKQPYIIETVDSLNFEVI